MPYNNQSQRRSYPQQTWNAPTITFTDDTYVSDAEAVIKEFKKTNFEVGRDALTTSQIRNLLALTSTIYDEILVSDFENVMDQVAYLRVQFVYQSGRNKAIKKLVEMSNILSILKDVQTKKDKKDMIRFCRYMEALVAYFKFYGGKD